MGTEAARLQPDEKVSADPQYSRWPSCRLWLGFRSRVSVDGGEGIRRVVSQPARQYQLWPGFWQHHSIQISWRRLQGPDDRRGRSRKAWLRRSKQAGRDRW